MEISETFEEFENIKKLHQCVEDLLTAQIISQEMAKLLYDKLERRSKTDNIYITKPFRNNEKMEETAWIFMKVLARRASKLEKLDESK